MSFTLCGSIKRQFNNLYNLNCSSGRTPTLCELMCYLFFYFSDDYNRVVLDQLPDVPDSDYINASYVDVSTSRQYYCSCMAVKIILGHVRKRESIAVFKKIFRNSSTKVNNNNNTSITTTRCTV